MKYSIKKVLVTGANGQLGRTIQNLEPVEYINFVFKTKDDLDITNKASLKELFEENNFDFCINCAAYTNVEQAEQTPEIAYKINAEGVKHIAEVCKATDTVLIHISTDYVFDGEKVTPYTEEDTPNPINEYGKSKLKGEEYVQKLLEKYYVVRTSWLYSKYGHNFFKTILKKAQTSKKIEVTSLETGTPTNANDFTVFLTKLITTNELISYGIYHFSNKGQATWFEFAQQIIKQKGKQKVVVIEKTNNSRTFVKRPKYSVLSSDKTIKELNRISLDWKESLQNLITDFLE